MKSTLSAFLALTACIGLAACATDHEQMATAAPAGEQTSTTAATGTETHEVSVQAPTTGQYNNVPDNGSTGAAKMISPITGQ